MKTFPIPSPNRSRFFVLILIAIASWPTSRALACACCSDPGMREDRVTNVTPYHRDQIRGMEFAPEASLFLTDAGEDEVKGISAIAETYQLTAKTEDKHWRLTFRTEDGKTGSLTLPIPAKVGIFQVDPRDGQKSAGGGPLLYKEWRWAGVPATDGIFKKGALRYALVFQGRGNRCDNGSDFTHWHLKITGKNISYALFGAFNVENAQPAKEAGEKAAD